MRKATDLDWSRGVAQVLREQGFIDIEVPVHVRGLETALKTSGRMTEGRIADHEAIALYYQRARGFLERHKFKTLRQRRIWELHCEGLSYKRIGQRMRVETTTGSRIASEKTILMLRKRMLSRRGRPPRPGGCYRGCIELNVKFQDGAAEALQYLAKRWGKPTRDVIRTLVVEAARVS